MPLINGTNGNDTITNGTSGNDTINGLDGNDRIEVTTGSDILDGGTGVDTLSFRQYSSIASAGISLTLWMAPYADSSGINSSFVNFENVWGTDFGDVIQGDTNSNEIAGFSGNDQLAGGGGAANTLIGGAGDDTYFLLNPGDTIVELPGEGVDAISYNSFGVGLGSALTGSISIMVPANVENVLPSTYAQVNPLGLSLTIIGNAENNQITGNGMADFLSGGAGNDILTTGNVPFFFAPDTLLGGTGNDTYVISTLGDTIIELAGEGRDTVQSGVAIFTLPDNVEDLLFSTGLGRVTGIGNELDNYFQTGAGGGDLFGRGGDDVLVSGVIAANTLVGGTGNDQYNVGFSGDSLVEYAGEGFDTASVVGGDIVAFTLPANVEALIWGTVGSGICIGNAGDNTISVENRGSDDFLSGMDGNDVFIGGNGSDL